MTKKLKSGTPFVYDENDRVVGIRDPHTGTDTDLVTAVMGPGGVVRNSLGDVIWKPGWNQMLNVLPTPVATVADFASAPRYSDTTNSGGGASIVDTERTDPCTGLPTLK